MANATAKGLSFHHRYNPAKVAGFQTDGPSMTIQDFKDDSDINGLIRRFVKQGSLYDPATLINRRPSQPQFGDFSNIPDLLTASVEIARAQEMFGQLPAEIRSFFNHDPLRLLAFVEQARNDKELWEKGVQLGILEARGAGAKAPANANPNDAPKQDASAGAAPSGS